MIINFLGAKFKVDVGGFWALVFEDHRRLIAGTLWTREIVIDLFT